VKFEYNKKIVLVKVEEDMSDKAKTNEMDVFESKLCFCAIKDNHLDQVN